MCKVIFLGMLLAAGQAAISTAQDQAIPGSARTNLKHQASAPRSTDRILSRSGYADKLYGFWLGQCIANWTGLVTEMDKICDTPQYKTGKF